MAFALSVGVTTTVAHATASDGTFSAAGAAAWNGVGAHTVVASGSASVSGATSGGVIFADSTTSISCSALLAANAVVLGGGAGTAPLTYSDLVFDPTNNRLTIGSGSAGSTGWTMGNMLSGYAAICATSLSFSNTNSALIQQDQNTYLNAPTGEIHITLALSDMMNITSTRALFNIVGQMSGRTVAQLPGSPAAGMFAYVTDSSTATWGATIAGGGANKVLAWYNNANWTVIGA